MAGLSSVEAMGKILIVDDEEPVHRVLRRVLERASYRVIDAFSGAEALSLASLEKPDLILLDIHMPDKDGREVLRDLRNDLRTQSIPVMFLTADGRIEDRVSGIRLGADDYVAKPFDIEEVAARVDGLIRRTRRDLSVHPLTRLPGSPSIADEVGRRLRLESPFAFLYADIDHFKAYNDIYGYAKGDEVIRCLALLLTETIDPHAEPQDFVGHIGGDDFALVLAADRAQAAARQIARRFDEKIPSFYSASDAARGHVIARDRQGREHPTPLMTVSIAIVPNRVRRLGHYGQVVDIAAEIKRYLKGLPGRTGSAYLEDRRADPRR